MDPRTRRVGLGVAVLLLLVLEVALRRFDLFAPLVGDSLPSTLFAALSPGAIPATSVAAR